MSFRLFSVLLAASWGWAQVVPIHQVQGREGRSPLEGQVVTVRGVVTGVGQQGFFLQELFPDQDPLTSEGLYVFTQSRPQALSRGLLVEVRGKVQEYVGSGGFPQLSLTELVNPEVTALGTAPLPEPFWLSPAPLGAWEQWKPLEGMRVGVPELLVTGPTLGVVDEGSALAQSRGVFFGVLPPAPRPFREPGVLVWEPLPSGASPQIPRFDGNPEVLRVSSTCLVGLPPQDWAAGEVVSPFTGVLTFEWGRYTLCPDQPLSGATFAAPPPPPPFPGLVAVASWNLQRFYDHRDDPALNEPVLSQEALSRRLEKAAKVVVGWLRCPPLLVVQEVESLEGLQALAEAVSTVALQAGSHDPRYQAVVSSTADPSGIRVGALVAQNPSNGISLTLERAEPILTGELFSNPDSTTIPLHDRPPLRLDVRLSQLGRVPLALTVVGVHLRSQAGITSAAPGSGGWPSEGERIRAKRKAQAESLAAWVEGFQAAEPNRGLLLLGDFNAFHFSDGLVDVVGTVAGTPAPAAEVLLPSGDLVSRDLAVLTLAEPPEERYSFVYDGSAQALDHALASQGLVPHVWGLWRPRLGADWPEVARNGPSPFRVSDHDPLVVLLELVRRPRPFWRR